MSILSVVASTGQRQVVVGMEMVGGGWWCLSSLELVQGDFCVNVLNTNPVRSAALLGIYNGYEKLVLPRVSFCFEKC